MSTERLTSIPAAIIAGDTVAITLSLSDYPAPTWALSWALAGPSTLVKASTDNANGVDHNLDLTAIQTSALRAGLYQWRLRAADGTEIITVANGVLTVVADLANLSDGDATPWEVTQLALVESAIAGTLEGEAKSIMIAGRQLQSFELDELWDLRSKLQRAVNRYQSGGQLPPVMVGRWKSNDSGWT